MQRYIDEKDQEIEKLSVENESNKRKLKNTSNQLGQIQNETETEVNQLKRALEDKEIEADTLSDRLETKEVMLND